MNPASNLDNVRRTKIIDAACRRIVKGGQEGRALFLRLHLMTQRHRNAYIEDRLKSAFDALPEDDRAIVEFVVRELDAALSTFFFSDTEADLPSR